MIPDTDLIILCDWARELGKAKDYRIVQVIVETPGKLILSGEHAVVYGMPALAVAVTSRKTRLTLANRDDEHYHIASSDFKYNNTISDTTLSCRSAFLQNRYAEYLQQNLPIHSVLPNHDDLVLYALYQALQHYKVTTGLTINISSNIPVGCGMGSSAAIILSILSAVAKITPSKHNHETMLQLAQAIENLQHGHSSGIDIQVIAQGAALYFDESGYHTCNLPCKNFGMINTGSPNSSTGSCVTHVKNKINDHLLDSFNQTTQNFYSALHSTHFDKIIAAIRQNHRLLVEIGVVPMTIQSLIHELENIGAAAKVCGAGSIKGDKAGMLLVYPLTAESVALCQLRGYHLEPLSWL